MSARLLATTHEMWRGDWCFLEEGSKTQQRTKAGLAMVFVTPAHVLYGPNLAIAHFAVHMSQKTNAVFFI